ncbi:hypothetical protein D3C81_1836740 [compost metagenome]
MRAQRHDRAQAAPAASLRRHGRRGAARRRVQHGGDGAERQPEAGPQHGPRVKQHNGAQRQAQHVNDAGDTPQPQGQRHHQQHIQGALRWHAEAGQQHIKKGRQRTGQRRHLLRRQPQGQLPVGKE